MVSSLAEGLRVRWLQLITGVRGTSKTGRTATDSLEEWTGSRLRDWRTSWRWATNFTSARPPPGLGIAQPALSKTVRQLERRLGVTLFERTSRAVTLTEAGRVLSREARVALEAVSAAALRTQRAGTREPRLILAMNPGGDAGLLPAILAAYEREPEALPVEVVFGAGPSRMLREGQADAALLHAPPDELGGLDTETLLTEAPVAVLPASHPLAQRASLPMP